MTDAALSVDRLVKRFGSREVLHEVSFTVDRGEFVALLGPNGAGKTTLFQILTGLYGTDSGSVCIAGHPMKNAGAWPEALGELGVVFQQPALDLDLSVQANLVFHAALHGLEPRSARARMRALLDRFGLSERASDQCRQLSGGTRRKVELARALLTSPKVLLMDEATVGLDPASRVQLLADVKSGCAEEERAVLWATHLTEEAEQADRVIVLHQGIVRYDGTVPALRAQQGTTSIESAFLTLTSGSAPKLAVHQGAER